MTTSATGSTDPKPIGAADQELPGGTEVGEYRIEGVAGRGGFGTVYRAVQPVIGKEVAIKVLARRFAADEAIVSRFVEEARAVNTIRHRNIIDIFSFGQLDDGRHYYVMEYLEGESLDAYVRTRGVLSLDEAMPIFKAIARALDAAHAKGIAHRDLKPENIFLARDSEGQLYPKLLDFGIAKLLAPEEDVRHRTGTGVPMGTPYYMSPEQCRGRDVDHRTDVYSFGIVAYRVLTGTFPFEGDYLDLLTKQTAEEPEPPSTRNPALPPAVDRAIAWMMKKDREARPRTVLAGVLALAEDGTALTTPAVGTTPSRATPVPGHGASETLPAASTLPAAPPAPSQPPLAPPGAPRASIDTTLRTRRRPPRWMPLVGLGVLSLAVGVTWLVATRGSDRAPAAAPPPAIPASAIRPEVPAEPMPNAAVAPAPPAPLPNAKANADTPAHVTLTLPKLPKGAEVLLDGRLLGVPPDIQVPYGSEKLTIVLRADGYQPSQLTIVPDHDQTSPVVLARKPRGQTAAPAPPAPPKPPSRDDLPQVNFGQ